ncbi:MAG: M14 family zinc carboxypeptidase [Candidatus Woesearchaeota archaeon]
MTIKNDDWSNDNSQCPGFWISTPREILIYIANNINQGEIKCITNSAGNRPVWSITYGSKGKKLGTSNFSAAKGSGNINSFLGTDANKKNPVVMIVGGTHGAEMEGVVGIINLLSILETGKDLLGTEWPYLEEIKKKVRIILIPLLNPDGRNRVKPGSLVGMSFEKFRYWAQGQWKNGELIGYPDCKKYQPLPLDKVKFMGGYPNDDGINLMHDVSLSGLKARETKAYFSTLEKERPDCVCLLHSHEGGPTVLGPDSLLPEPHQDIQWKIKQKLYQVMKAKNMRPGEISNYNNSIKRPLFNMSTASYATSGTVPFVFEGPHGLSDNMFSHEEILKIQLTLYKLLFENVLKIPINSSELN